ncbi:hypothetical protein QWZ03_17875 [Chitinimonas viridis]|uniref:SMI1/KNR4 family protein n=1 Tax=Chitinimonas viridis TaxID=664880 RepID=A0ABT8B9E0_9NEIS|nr:hypothetical protein [Chitinimonas viridis]MDN3578640.1 hypothetical protein [Chitinimonas viridis]
MPYTREQAYLALATLNPAPVFLDAYRTRALPRNLDIYIGVPEEFFIAPDAQEAYTANVLIPILDDGNFGLVTFLNPESGELVQMYVEDDSGEPHAIHRGWQQYLACLLVRISESEDNDEALREIAGLVGFSEIDAFTAFMTQSGAMTGKAYELARERFIRSVSV